MTYMSPSCSRVFQFPEFVFGLPDPRRLDSRIPLSLPVSIEKPDSCPNPATVNPQIYRILKGGGPKGACNPRFPNTPHHFQRLPKLP